jgi:hypothetical protein
MLSLVEQARAIVQAMKEIQPGMETCIPLHQGCLMEGIETIFIPQALVSMNESELLAEYEFHPQRKRGMESNNPNLIVELVIRRKEARNG